MLALLARRSRGVSRPRRVLATASDLTELSASVEIVAAYRYVSRVPDGPLPPVALVVLPNSSICKILITSLERFTS